jgi:hypothetical protein
VRISLALPAGIVGDDTDFSSPTWRDALNVRFWGGKPEMIKGWERLTQETLSGVCRTAFMWHDGMSIPTLALGCHDGLSIWQGGQMADITPVDFVQGQVDGTGGAGYGAGAFGVGGYGEPANTDYFPLTWSFGVRSFGELYSNPRGQGIFVWNNDPDAPAEPLENAPAQANVILVAFTDQVLAFGCEDVGGQFNAACIRGSDAADPTQWMPGTTNTAFQFYLKGNGRIVGAQAIGNSVFVWTETELHVGTYNLAWNFEPVGAGGLCGPNAAAVVGHTAYWISPDRQFYACPLGGAPSLMVCPIRDDFADHAAMGQDDKINAVYLSERGEVVWSYADGRDGYECSRELRLSVLDGAWSRSAMTRTALCAAVPAPVGVSFDGAIYWHERGTSADGAALTGHIETGGQYLDPAENVMLIRGFYPDFKDQKGPIRLQVWGKMEPQDTWTELTDQMVGVGQSKVDFLGSARIAKVRFSSNSSPAEWRMGKPQFDIVGTGQG